MRAARTKSRRTIGNIARSIEVRRSFFSERVQDIFRMNLAIGRQGVNEFTERDAT